MLSKQFQIINAHHSESCVAIKISQHIGFKFVLKVQTELCVDEKYNDFGVWRLCSVVSNSYTSPRSGFVLNQYYQQANSLYFFFGFIKPLVYFGFMAHQPFVGYFILNPFLHLLTILFTISIVFFFFFYTQLNGKTVLFQIIQFSISTQFSSI